MEDDTPDRGLLQLSPLFFILGIIFLIIGSDPNIELGVGIIGMTLFLTGSIFYGFEYLGKVLLHNENDIS